MASEVVRPDGETLQIWLSRLGGLAVLASLFLPWVHGPGLLSDRWLTGYDLLRLSSHVRLEDLSALEAASALALRWGILASVAFAMWHLGAVFLAPASRLCRISAGALGVLGGLVAIASLAWEGGAPGTGALLAVSGGLAAAWPVITPKVRARLSSPSPVGLARVASRPTDASEMGGLADS